MKRVFVIGRKMRNKNNMKKQSEMNRNNNQNRNNQTQLAKESELLNAIMDNIPDNIYFKDLESKFTRINKAQAKALGVKSPEEAIGKTDFDFFNPEHASTAHKDEQEIIKTGQPLVNKEEKMKMADGKYHWVSATKVPVKDKNGQIVGLVGISRDITERKKARDAIEESQQKLKRIFKKNPEPAVYLDKNSHIIDINPRFTDTFGYTLDEIKGKHINKVLVPDENIQEAVMLDEKAKEGYLYFDTYRKRKDGTLIPVSISAAPIAVNGELTSYFALYKDISYQKKTEEDLQKSKQKFERMFKGNPEPAVYLDKNSHIIDINPRFTDTFGYTLDEIKGKHINKVLVPDENIQEAVMLDEKAKEGYLYFDTYRKRKDGTLIPVSISAAPIVASGELSNYFVMYKDITKQKYAEDINLALYNISKAVQSTASLKELFQSIHRSISNIIDTTNFRIALVDKERNILTVPYCVDEKDDYKDLQLFGSKSAVEKIVKSGKSLLMKKNEFMKQISEGTLKLYGSLPEVWLGVILKAKNEIIGTMSLQSYSNPEAFSEKDVKLMELISEQVALAIQYKRAEEEKEKLIDDLQKALYDVKRLNGLIPICANCKKIRDDKGYWEEVEKYISERSDVDFTHGLCPDCMKKLYPDIYEKIYGSKSKADNIRK